MPRLKPIEAGSTFYGPGGQYIKSFPAAKTATPESAVNEQIQAGRKQIQDRFALQWDEINRSARFIGQQKALNMRRELHTKAKQEMLQFNQQAQAQTNQLQRITMMGERGLIPNADQIKARMVFGADVAKSMYPEPERELPIPEQFGKLDVYSHRISQELERFKEDKPSKLLKRFGYISPKFAGAISTYRGKPKRKVQMWDPTKLKYVKATPEETAEYDMWLREEKDVAARKLELTGQLGISRRIVQPGTTGGTFGDKIAASVRPRQQQPTTKPKVVRQRNTRTGQERISYDNGRTWEMIGR